MAQPRDTAIAAALRRAVAAHGARPVPTVTLVTVCPTPQAAPPPEPPPALVVVEVARLIPAGALRKVIPPGPEEVLARELEAIRDRVRRNEPKHRDPERFHEEKSEICGDISRLVSDLRKGRAPPRGRADPQG